MKSEVFNELEAARTRISELEAELKEARAEIDRLNGPNPDFCEHSGVKLDRPRSRNLPQSFDPPKTG